MENETPETSEETPESQAEETETDETGSEKQEEVLEELFDEEPTEETTTHTEELQKITKCYVECERKFLFSLTEILNLSKQNNSTKILGLNTILKFKFWL